MLGVCCVKGYRVGECGDRGCHGGRYCVEGHKFGDCGVGGCRVGVRCVDIHSVGRCSVGSYRVGVYYVEGHSVRGLRFEGYRSGVNCNEGHIGGECGVGGCCKGRVYVNNLICGVCRWSELMLLRNDMNMELRDLILWKCMTM